MPYPILIDDFESFYRALAIGHCVTLVGLSNTGKTVRLRNALSTDGIARIEVLENKPVLCAFVDCNRMVELTAQGFYEVILRAMLDQLPPGEYADRFGVYHKRVVSADNVFQASLNFNEALTLLCEEQPANVILIFDEFDDVYMRLDVRVLLNLRAFRDRYGLKLSYVCATVRQLPELRGHEKESEFSELFSEAVFYLGMLAEVESRSMAVQLASRDRQQLTENDLIVLVKQSGGHPGLLAALTRALLRHRRRQPTWVVEDGNGFETDHAVRGECVKLWNQLTTYERETLQAVVHGIGSTLSDDELQNLERYSLVQAGAVFSPQFSRFVATQTNVPTGAPTGLYIDYDSGEVWVDGERVDLLTDLEHKLLTLLDTRRDKLTDKYMIVERVWGDNYIDQVDDARIEKLVSRLRSKIEPDPATPRFLLTVRGRGYRLVSNRGETEND